MTFCFKKILVGFIVFTVLFPQDNHPYPPLDLVSIPTSGTLPRGSYTIEGLLTKNGGLVPKIMIGLNNNFTLGMSFGVQNFIGEEKLGKNKDVPEVHLKYRVFEETESGPAFLIGIDTQGFGPYIESAYYKTGLSDIEGTNENESISYKEINRYEQKAWGIYAVASKNWSALGNLGFHIGLNRNTFERKDNDKSINYFFGLDKELNRSFSLLLEYNAALNDGNEYSTEQDFEGGLTIGKGKGFLNAGLRWTIAENLLIEVNLKDINLDDDDYVNREVKIMYSEKF